MSTIATKAFEEYLNWAAQHARHERFIAVATKVVFLLAAVASCWALLQMVWPQSVWGVPAIGSLLVLCSCLLLLCAWFSKANRKAISQRLDRLSGLPDAVLSAAELTSQAGTEWHERQITQTIQHLKAVDWRKAWPVQTPRLFWPLLIFGAVMWLFLCVQFGLLKGWEEMNRISPAFQVQMNQVEKIFQDWEQYEKENPTQEMKELLQEVKPLREQMTKQASTEEEMLRELNRVEDRLSQKQMELRKNSMESISSDLAEALQSMDGMSELAAALRKKDFEKAEKLADKAHETWKSPSMKMPQGSKARQTAAKFSKLSQMAGNQGNSNLQTGLQQLKDGIERQNQSQACSGLKKLQECFGKECQSKKASQCFSLQLNQLKLAKQCLSSGQCRSFSLMPQLCKSPGKGAGSSEGDKSNGEETNLASNRAQENLTGALGTGDSEMTIEKTDQSASVATSQSSTATYEQYEKLSMEALEDENIPLAHREVIKRYFEKIRPGSD